VSSIEYLFKRAKILVMQIENPIMETWANREIV
jgi:hypothetical protein